MEYMGLAKTVLGVVKDVYDIIQEVRHFEHRSRRLANRVKYLEPTIKALADRAVTRGDPALFKGALEEMLELIKKIREFIKSFQNMNCLMRCIRMFKIRKEFDEHNEQLATLTNTLILNVVVDGKVGQPYPEEERSEEDKEDREQDEKVLLLELREGQDTILEDLDKLAQGQNDIKKTLQGLFNACVEATSVAKGESKIEGRHGVQAGLKQIDPNQLTRKTKIGTQAGRFSTTYKAEYMHEMVALKTYDIGDDRDTKKFLLKEAATLHHMNSSYVVRLWGVWTNKAPYMLVFEYMARGNLRKVLDEVGADLKRLPWEKRVQMALDGSLGLYRMHNMTPRSLVHQDVGSDIFLVDSSLKMKISGVGFAETQTSIMKKSKPARDTRSTLNYISPERLKDPKVMPAAATDVYSYGIVMWEIATGSKPYADLNDSKITDFVLRQKRKLPLGRDCPQGFTELIDQCRNFDPLTRPTTSEIVAGLQKLRSSLE